MKTPTTDGSTVLPVRVDLPSTTSTIPPAKSARPPDRYDYPFEDPDLPIERRIDSIVSLLTLEEKIDCLGTNPSVPRLGIKACGHVEGLHGLAMGGPSDWGQKHPAPTTIFPQAIGLAQTWDVELVRQVAEVESYETRYMFQHPKYARGGLVVRAPNADLGRDPRWGRNEECYGEDPYFNGTMVVAFVRGLQGDDPRYLRTAALLKHFLANSNENERERSSSDFDQRLLREYYSVPFRMGIVEGGAPAFMAAYNRFNGIPCTVHPILRNITVNEWGLDGIICTDGGALKLLVTHHQYYPTLAQGAAWSVRSGITQFLDKHKDAVREAVDKCLLSEEEIDAALRGNFRVMIRLGLLDPPQRVAHSRIGAESEPEPWLSEPHRALARRATQKSIVLLKNEGSVLPLDRTRLRKIAVIGPRADQVLLDWYSGTPPYAVSPLRGIIAKVGDGVEVVHSKDDAFAAKDADVAIVCVGNHPTCNAGWARTLLPSDGKEAVDRDSITLEDETLVKAVLAANPRTVVALFASFPYDINWAQANVPAIVQMTHSSQETGNALADVLFGDVNPAGRLVQTWPKSIDDLPPMMDYDIRRGRTYMYFDGEPLYPFGHGLSYTRFEYSNLRTSARVIDPDGSITVSVDITNAGDRDGEEVPQLYVSYLDSKVGRPRRQLAAFVRIAIGRRQTVTCTFTLRAAQLSYWDVRLHRFVVEPGRVRIMVGASSADIRLESNLQVQSATRAKA